MTVRIHISIAGIALGVLAAPALATQPPPPALQCRLGDDEKSLAGGARSEQRPFLRPQHFLPTAGERIGRAFDLKLQILDQQNLFFRTIETLPSEDRPEGDLRLVSFPNPDRKLFKYAVTLDFAKLVLTQDERNGAFSAARIHPDRDERLGQVERDPVSFFLARRPSDRLLRFFSAFTIEGGLSQRRQLLNGRILADAVLENDEYEATISVKFDPQVWFDGGTRFKKGVVGLDAYSKINRRRVEIPEGCKTETAVQCLARLSATRRRSRVAAAAIPVFEVMTVDQFDFFNVGGSFQPLRALEDTLETYTLKWHLGRAFKARSERRAVAAALATIGKLEKRDDQLKEKPKIDRGVPYLRAARPGELVYVPFRATGGLPTLKWCWAVLSDHPCVDSDSAPSPVPGLRLDQDGLLHGYPTRDGSFEFVVQVTDLIDRFDRLTCALVVSAWPGAGQATGESS